ncbi:MAG: transcription initiation factor IIB [Promethearchaeota archaeon]
MEKIKEFNYEGNKCPECGGYIISIPESGDILCGQCGLILDEKIMDYGHSGRRAFTTQEKNKRERTGSPISSLLPDMGLTTVIDRKDIQNPDLKRAAKWNTRMSWEKRNLLIASTELKRIASNLNLPDYVKKEAIRIYKEAFKNKLLRGRSIDGMVAACIYYAIRIKKIPRTLQEILNETNTSDKKVRRCYRTLITELNLKPPNTDPIALVPKYISKLQLGQDVHRMTIELINQYKSKATISGKDPKGICAGAIYLATKILKQNFITQKEIAQVIGVTEVTLRSRYKELAKIIKLKQ